MINFELSICFVNGKWVFEKDNKKYDLAPSGIVEFALNPLIFGVDKFLEKTCALKNIKSTNLKLSYSNEYIPNADVKINFVEQKLNGYVYSLEELNLKGFYPGQAIWICSYMLMFYETYPNEFYLKLSSV